MAEVLKHLTSVGPPLDTGPDQEDIDALHDDILANTVRINELDALVARLEEVKVQASIRRAYATCCPPFIHPHVGKTNTYKHSGKQRCSQAAV